jgi:hypothetical protein
MIKPKWDAHRASMDAAKVALVKQLPPRDAREWISDELRQIYQIFWDHCANGVSEAAYHQLLEEMLDLGALMHLTQQFPSLLSMPVPYQVRKFFYSNYELLRDVIAHCVNDEGKPYARWCVKQAAVGKEVVRITHIAHALWKWYYYTHLPIATRFERFGREDFSSDKYERTLAKVIKEESVKPKQNEG